MKSFLVILFLICGTLTKTDCSECTRAPEECLVSDLLTDYQIYARPVIDPADEVEVVLTFTPSSLIGIDEKNEQVNMVAIVSAAWSDPRLSWNSSEYSGAEKLNIRAEKIWLPDIVLFNSADTFYHKTHREDFFALVTSDGTVYWVFGGIFSTSCSLQITHYPFDSQTCGVEFQSWTYTTDMVRLVTQEDIDFDDFSSNALWNNDSSEIEIFNVGEGDIKFSAVTFSITWTRKRLYYYFNIMLPVFLLLVTTFANFWLPPESGERVSLAITLLLAYAVFLIVIMDNTPTNSENVPVISEFVMSVMAASTLSLLESLLIVFLHFKHGRPPRWLRKFTFVYLARFFCARDEVPEVDDELQSKGSSAVMPLTDVEDTKPVEKKPKLDGDMAVLSEAVQSILGILQDKLTEESYADEWKLAAKMLDRLMFLISLIAFGITTIVLFAISA